MGYIILGVIAVIIEGRIRVLGGPPDATVVIVYMISLRKGATGGLVAGAIMGIAVDGIAGGMLGPNLVAKATAGFLAGKLREFFFGWTPFAGFLMLGAVTLADRAVSYGVYSIFASVPMPFLSGALMIASHAGLNAIAGAFIKPGETR